MKYPNDESAEDREARLREKESAKVEPGRPAKGTGEDDEEAEKTARNTPPRGNEPPQYDPNRPGSAA